MIRFWERAFVWTGGALFAGSLAATAWLYGRRFAMTRTPGGWWPVVIDAALITGFAAHHSVFARQSVKHAIARTIPDRLLRAVYVWTASLLLMGVCVAWRTVGGDIYRVEGTAAWVFAAVQTSGLWMIVLAVKAIRTLELAGIRPPNTADELQVRGPYAYVRHPLYLGWILIVFAPAHMTGDRLVFAALTTIYLIVAIPWEERSLEQAFGQSYARYRKVVRWRILPYLY